MSLEALECPVCGANVQADPTAPLLACRYCNTVLQ